MAHIIGAQRGGLVRLGYARRMRSLGDTPHLLFPVDRIRAIEREALARSAPGELMSRAAHALMQALESLLRQRPAGTPIHAFCGPGNNGGDALLAALLLDQRGWPVRTFELAGACAQEQPPEDTARVRARANAAGLLPQRLDSEAALRQAIVGEPGGLPPLLVDGLFGIGLARPLDGLAARFCRLAAEADAGVVAVDVPSGLDADTGAIVGGPDGTAVRALLTVTMIADKPGLHTGAACDHAGRAEVAPLGLDIAPPTDLPPTDSPRANLPADRPVGRLFTRADARRLLPARPHDSSKGSFGSVLIVGGARGMHGAALLAGRGAQCVGAGKVWIASPDGPVFDPAQPQLMTCDADAAFPERATLVAGCGLGTDQRAATLLQRVLTSGRPAVLDADALNLLPDLAGHDTAAGERVLTPHPLEAARLAGVAVATLQADRIGAARRLAARHAAVVLLKGAGTVIAAPDGRWVINAAGGPALASAGSGDVLAGLIGGLMAQGMGGFPAAQLGCWIHAAGGDRWTEANGHPGGLSAAELPMLARSVLGALARP